VTTELTWQGKSEKKKLAPKNLKNLISLLAGILRNGY
jgi:hypothetical protein